MSEFGQVLARARRRRKWSQRKLAQVTGLSRSYINDIEHGRSAGTVSTWVTLARALGLSLDEVFIGQVSDRAGLLSCAEKQCRYCARPSPGPPRRQLKKRT